MKKVIINYTTSIWFKIMNDKISRTELVLLGLITFGLSYIGIHAYAALIHQPVR